MSIDPWEPLADAEGARESWHAALNPWRMHERRRATWEWRVHEKRVRVRALAVLRCRRGCELGVVWQAASGRAIFLTFNRVIHKLGAGMIVRDSRSRDGDGSIAMLEDYLGEDQVPKAAFGLACEHLGKDCDVLRLIAHELLTMRVPRRPRKGIVGADGSLKWASS